MYIGYYLKQTKTILSQSAAIELITGAFLQKAYQAMKQLFPKIRRGRLCPYVLTRGTLTLLGLNLQLHKRAVLPSTQYNLELTNK